MSINDIHITNGETNIAAVENAANLPGDGTKPTEISGVNSPGEEIGGSNAPCSDGKGQFSDPVYKKLAVLNGEINKMTKQEMKEKLAKLNLDTRGQKDVLKKRLKNFVKRRKLGVGVGAAVARRYDFLLVIDFEATCERRQEAGIAAPYRHEIIEFPVILVDVAARKQVDEFHSYVRPVNNPVLSSFCTELTGITQEQVGRAPVFVDVLRSMEAWMDSHSLGKTKKFAIVTDGPWDMSRFLYLQCRQSALPLPPWARRWINVRKSYACAYQQKRGAGIEAMLAGLGLALHGPLHSGIADARNIARIVTRMLHDDCNLRVNECMRPDKMAAVGGGLSEGGAVVYSVTAAERCGEDSEGEERGDEIVGAEGGSEPTGSGGRGGKRDVVDELVDITGDVDGAVEVETKSSEQLPVESVGCLIKQMKVLQS